MTEGAGAVGAHPISDEQLLELLRGEKVEIAQMIYIQWRKENDNEDVEC